MPQLTPQLLTEISTRVSRKRILPQPGRILVSVGDVVTPTSIVAQVPIAGELHIVKVPELLDTTIDNANAALKVAKGFSIEKGERLAYRKSLFGLLASEALSPVSGIIEEIYPDLAHVAIRTHGSSYDLRAYIEGTVLAIDENLCIEIEGKGALVQGVFGVGGESFGELHEIPGIGPLLTADIDQGVSGKITFTMKNPNSESLAALAAHGGRGLVVGSITDAELAKFVGHPICLAVTGREDVPFPLLITEGFGDLPISRRCIELLRKLKGSRASISGITQIRAGAVRPELFVANNFTVNQKEEATLAVGTEVRVVRGKSFGKIGKITKLPHELIRLRSGVTTLVAEILGPEGETSIVARVNIEIV